MARVKIVRPTFALGRRCEVGEILDLDNDLAALLVHAGKAEAIGRAPILPKLIGETPENTERVVRSFVTDWVGRAFVREM